MRNRFYGSSLLTWYSNIGLLVLVFIKRLMKTRRGTFCILHHSFHVFYKFLQSFKVVLWSWLRIQAGHARFYSTNRCLKKRRKICSYIYLEYSWHFRHFDIFQIYLDVRTPGDIRRQNVNWCIRKVFSLSYLVIVNMIFLIFYLNKHYHTSHITSSIKTEFRQFVPYEVGSVFSINLIRSHW